MKDYRYIFVTSIPLPTLLSSMCLLPFLLSYPIPSNPDTMSPCPPPTLVPSPLVLLLSLYPVPSSPSCPCTQFPRLPLFWYPVPFQPKGQVHVEDTVELSKLLP